MNKFCQACGNPIQTGDRVCTECGTPVEQPAAKSSPSRAATSTKKPWTKKQKVISSVVVAVFVLFLGFYMWGQNYVSPEKTMDRFINAMTKNDEKALQHLAIVGHGKFITKAEAKALVSLKENDVNYMTDQFLALKANPAAGNNQLFRVIENGKWLGIFKRYSILLKSQYAEIDNPFKGVKNTFNGKSMPVKSKEGTSRLYGPMAPGIYQLKSEFSGDYASASAKDKLILADENGEVLSHDVDLDASYVTLALDNEKGAPIEKAYAEINGKKIDFNKNGEIRKLGPIKLDGKTSAIATVQTAWGSVTTEKIPIKSDYVGMPINTVNDKLLNTLTDVIQQFGEEYFEARAKLNVSNLSNITSSFKDDLTSDFIEFKNNDEYFTGQLEKLEFNFDALEFYDDDDNIPLATVPTKFYYKGAEHSRGEQAELTDQVDLNDVVLQWNSKDKKWLVHENSSSSVWFDDFKVTKTVEGTKKKYSPTKVTAAKEDYSKELEQFMISYNEESVNAINERDFSIVAGMINPDGPRYEQQKNYIDDLEARGITEEHLSTSLESAKKVDDNTWEVITNETFNIITEDSTKERSFRTINQVKNVHGQWKLHKLIDTK